MKKVFKSLRDTVIAGTLFLLPVLGLIVLITKIFHMFQAYAAKLADLLGLDSLAGIPTPVLVVSISLVAICLLCGYLVRITFFKHISAWIDEKLRKLVPGYEKYHQLAALKLKGEEMFPRRYDLLAQVMLDEVGSLEPTDVEGLSAGEVGELLGISDGNQRVLLHRGRARLRAGLEAKLGRP